jgi:hypothetical protein
VNANKKAKAGVDLAKEKLRRQVQEEYSPAFAEVSDVLAAEGLYREDVLGIAPAFRTNRFLNWLRLTHVLGDAWKDAPHPPEGERKAEVARRAAEWCSAEDGRVAGGYAEGIQGVLAPFADADVLRLASKEALTDGLLGLHAFVEQLRFTSGGRDALPARFWRANGDDVERVRHTLGLLLHGQGDLVNRLYAVVSDDARKLALFGKFCGLELLGTVKPEECPPVNGRSAKALRFLGYRVSAE